MKKILSLILSIFIISTVFTFPAHASGEITILSPGASCTTDLSQIEVECENAEKIIFELDGTKIGETSGETVLPLDAGTITVGNHTLRVSAIFSDKTAAQDEISFNAHKMIVTKSFSENFNSYVSGTPASVGFDSKSKSTLSPDVGASSSAEDKSLKFALTTGSDFSNNGPMVRFKNFTNYGANGIVTLKFKLKTNDSKLRMWLLDMPLFMTNETNFIRSGKFYGTSVEIGVGAWKDIEYISDYTNNKTILKVGGREQYNDTMTTSIYATNKEVSFNLLQSGERTNQSDYSVVWFDDVEIKQELAYGIKSFLYADDEGWTSCGSEKIPADTSKLKLILTEALDGSTINTNTVSVYENGAKLTLSDVTYDNTEKSIVVTPSQSFGSGSEIVVKLADTVKLSGGQVTGTPTEARTNTQAAQLTPSSVTFKKNDSLLLTSAQLEEGDVVKLDVTLNNDTAEPKSMTVIVQVRQNEKLRSLGAKSVIVGAGETPTVTVTLPPIASLDAQGDISVKMSLCDTYENGLPYMTYTEIK